MLKLPFHFEIEKAKTILLAGAGGGFDLFSGLPLYFALVAAGKRVHLANLTFSNIPPSAGRRLCSEVVEVSAESDGSTTYFPEKQLARWFQTVGQDVSIWAIERYGPAAVTRAYRALAQELNPDTIILVDGGTDSLMRGDEFGLGTPVEDISSIIAVESLSGIDRKLLVCLGFGIDHFHHVCHADVLESIAELSKVGGYLGAFSLLWEMPEVKLFVEATRYVLDHTPSRGSIVTTSILSAVAGAFGDVHVTTRTEGSELFINPLMALYWTFQVSAVAKRNLYLDRIRDLEGFVETEMAIEAFRDTLKRRKPFKSIPL